MSREIDLTKPLSELSEDDLRYAHDRSLFSPEDTERVGIYLRELDESRRDPEVTATVTAEGMSETETVHFNPSEHTVDEVVEYLNGLEDDGPGTEEYERVLAAERADKNRKGIVGED